MAKNDSLCEQQTDLQYCAVALLKALTTYNLHSATEMYRYKDYTDRNIMSFTHKCTNNVQKIMILPCTSPPDAIYANMGKTTELDRHPNPNPNPYLVAVRYGSLAQL